MKKVFMILAAAALVLAAAGCSNGSSSSSDTSANGKINGGASVVDFANATVNEDASVNNAVIVQNADFNGHTLTVNASGVTLSNIKNASIVAASGIGTGSLTIKDCTVNSFTVAGGGSNSIHVSGTTIMAVTITKESVRLVLEGSGITAIATLTVSTTGAKIEGCSTSVIAAMDVTSDADDLTIAGGTITAIKVTASSGSTPVITVAAKVAISTVTTKDAAGAETASSLVVSDAAKAEGYTVPSGVTEVTVKSAELVTGSTAKKSYETGDSFDFTGLSARLTYSNSATKDVPLTAANCKITGFDTAAAGSCTVGFTYNGTLLSGTLPLTVTATTKEYQKLIDAGLSCLANRQYDDAITKFNAAYTSAQNDTTRMYYALAQLATISTDSSVSKILTDNFGFKSYPSTLNALLSSSWMKEYVNTRRVWCVPVAKDTAGYYVRVSAKESSSGTWTYGYKQLSSSDWYSSEFCLDSSSVTESDAGAFLISTYSYTTITGKTAGTGFLYTPDWNNEYTKYIKTGTSTGPEFKIPSWLASNTTYTGSLLDGAQTMNSLEFILAANIMDCNKDGFNSLADNVVSVFGTKFATAKQLASELSEESVVLPSSAVSAFGLTDMLGSSSIKIGKAELDALIGSLEIVQGTFQFISAYDMSCSPMNMSNTMNNATTAAQFASYLRTFTSSKTLSVRNASAVASAKATFLDAADLLMYSYTYITEKSASYPDAAKDQITSHGAVYYSAIKAASDAIRNNSVFYIPAAFPDTTWPTTSSGTKFGIDMGKLFTAGSITDMIERATDGSWQVYVCDKDTGTLSKLPSDVSTISSARYAFGYKFNRTVAGSMLPGLVTTGTSDIVFFIGLYHYFGSGSSFGSNQ